MPVHDSGMGEQVTLRPVREDDLLVMEMLTGDPETAGEFAWFGWVDPGRWRRAWAEHEMLGADGGALIVMRGDERLGFVNWARRNSTPGGYFWEIGIALLPQARGHGYGTEAHRLLARYLFAHTTAHRIAAATEVDNIAEQKALEKAGFTREGVTRAGGWRAGAWRDGVTYSLLRTDPPV
jgi:RimJ/RimL family protein N-acetyltransferase